MKKFWKVILSTGLFCLLAGLAVAAVLIIGYQDELREHADEFSINEDNFFELFANNTYISVSREGTHYNKSETKESYHFAVEDTAGITGIDFEIAVGEVEFRTGESMDVQVTDMYEGAITSYAEDGIWYITDRLLESGSVHSEYCPEIVVTVPEDSSFGRHSFFVSSGYPFIRQSHS